MSYYVNLYLNCIYYVYCSFKKILGDSYILINNRIGNIGVVVNNA